VLFTLLIIAVCFVAFTNGANANFKGVASLYGSGTTSLRVALLWGTAMTFAGSVTAPFVAKEIAQKFSGRDIVPAKFVEPPDAQSPDSKSANNESLKFLTAVALAAALTSFLATRCGFPVSTTHALVGALVGAGYAAAGSEVNLAPLGKNVLLPLFLSPLVAAVCGGVLYLLLRALHLAPDKRTPTLDGLHFLSTGAASFARGLNDTPKMAVLFLVTQELDFRWGYAAVAVMILLGGLLDADKVAETLGKKVTDMNPGQGFAASLVTASLVITATIFGLPLSTTHVSVGSLLGIGVTTGQAKWKMVGEILLAWFSTVPCGALFAAAAYWLLSLLH
jgi:PiT family inorganic phosphate transporter